MTVMKSGLRLLVLLAAGIALYFGVVQGEWAETMFNATLL